MTTRSCCAGSTFFFLLNDGCRLSPKKVDPGIQPDKIEDVQVQAVWGPDDLRAAADHPGIRLVVQKLEDFESGVRHGSILHSPVAVQSPLWGLLGASSHDSYLGSWECFGASWEGVKAS